MALAATTAILLPHKLAEAKGFFLARGVDMQVMLMRSDVLAAAMGSGESDYSGQLPAAIRYRLAGMPITIIGTVVGRSTRQLVSQPHYNAVSELKGKVIVTGALAGTDTYVLRRMLRFHGLDPDGDVTILAAGDVPGRWATLQTGRAEGAVFSVGDLVQARELGMKVLASAADSVDMPENGISVTDQKLIEQPHQVKAVLHAMLDSVAFIEREPVESARVLAEWTGVDERQALLQIEALAPTLSRDLTTTDEGLRQVIEAERTAASVTREVLISEVANFSLLQEVLRERSARPHP
jgi:NitT/TauT family transport system substrate-binding protein